eukprot:11147480-Alexandrium_andersonii.AAC.1
MCIRDRHRASQGGSAPLGPLREAPPACPPASCRWHVRHLREQRRRTHPSRSSGTDSEAVSEPAQFK